MNVFITGGEGFIGRNLVEQLESRYNILAPSHNELELTDSSRVDEYFKNNNIDFVIHCATRFERSRKKQNSGADVVKENLQMFFNIAKNSRHCKRIINCGTGGEYNKDNDIKSVKEEDFGKSIPNEDYCFSKYAISKYIENSDEEIVNLRLFGVFGKYEDYNTRFISNAICRNLLKLPIVIYQNVLIDYVYADDVVKIIDYFMLNKAKYKSYNVGTGKPVDLLSLAEKVNNISGSRSEIQINAVGFGKEYSCDNSRLIREIDGFNFTPINDALRKMHEHYKKNIGELDLSKFMQ